jgi:hypothetical protein
MGEESGKIATEKGGFCSKTRSKRVEAKEAKSEYAKVVFDADT